MSDVSFNFRVFGWFEIFSYNFSVSLLGSIQYICQPLGSLISAWMSEPLGRKRSMFIVNIPHLIGWLIMHNASETWHVFAGVSLFGLGVGLMEAPILTYIGEIW